MVTREEHDLVVRWIAANRFPFPAQRNWPACYVTITNDRGGIRGVPGPAGIIFPDIIIIDGATQQIAEVGEVEIAVSAQTAKKWARFSAACKPSSTGARSFFVYVPTGMELEAQRLLDAAEISYAGVRAYTIEGGQAGITPVVTLGDVQDHR